MFCFTGKFYAGKRTWCEQQIIDNGGLVSKKSITKDLDYLVIGEIGTPDWLHSTHGLKIEAAIDYRNKHQKIAIISEAHWLTQMDALIQCGEPYRIEARLRYRISDSAQLTMWYDLVRPHKSFEDAVQAAWEQVETATEQKILHVE